MVTLGACGVAFRRMKGLSRLPPKIAAAPANRRAKNEVRVMVSVVSVGRRSSVACAAVFGAAFDAGDGAPAPAVAVAVKTRAHREL